ncbi:BOI-related E3 ubiquitin-protein ligase 1-like [Prunus avium]|uniref:BOI-related E3 ubiquitin-protein ligase 1-like n=1 Tax=Prunus avium TaxID=42229 RepID=A0A6P5TKK1_PRUAV|nr:BOI-related E3 ubiquitin-protein ligase 1-like [Prunus avium]
MTLWPVTGEGFLTCGVIYISHTYTIHSLGFEPLKKLGVVLRDERSTLYHEPKSTTKKRESIKQAQGIRSFIKGDNLDAIQSIFKPKIQGFENLSTCFLQRKRQARRIMEAIEVGMVKRPRAKREEIEKIRKLNWALEEKVKSLCIKNHVLLTPR